MILVKKDINKIFLISMTAKKKQVIVDIMEMIIENQSPNKRYIKHRAIGKKRNFTHAIPNHEIRHEESSRQCNKHKRNQIDIRIKVHPPPESVAKAGDPFLPFSDRSLFFSINQNECQAKQRTENRRPYRQFEILLNARKE